ncbi:winged helix DNA-binding protein [Kocuria rhizophila]|nr:winged helix DNA-binding protein [Kocuria rhizophila]
MLSEAPRRRREKISALATATNTSQSRLSRIVARMERDRAGHRQGRQDDRRVVIAEITPAGLERIRGGRAGPVRHVREIVLTG